jgi:hypothetical protein
MQTLTEMRALVGKVVTIVLAEPTELIDGRYAIGRLTAVGDDGEAIYIDQVSGLVHYAWPALDICEAA